MSRVDEDIASIRGKLSWPSGEIAWHYLQIMVLLSALFVLVYGSANQLASLRDHPYYFFADWELRIPFLPEMIYCYFSICILFLVPLFLMNKDDLQRLGIAAALCILFAGYCFVIFPGKTGFPPAALEQYAGTLEAWIFDALYSLDKPYNTVPSLHVGLSTLVVLSAGSCLVPNYLKYSLILWLCIIMISVVLVHQHHILDVVSGWALGYAGYLYYRFNPQGIN